MVTFVYKCKRIFRLTVIFTCIFLSISYINRNPFYLKQRLLEKLNYKTDYKYPGSFVGYAHPYPSNESYCTFNYGLPHDFKYNDTDLTATPEIGKNSEYRILYNVVESNYGGDLPGVTYATHISAEFTNYIAEVARLWEGPISVAAFAPHTDAGSILQVVNQLCYCLPDMSRVSLHLVFMKNLPPDLHNSDFSRPANCNVPDVEKITTFRSEYRDIAYPINVCRNAARVSADTKHILVSDIQLLPSEKLASRFVAMLDKYRISISANSKLVFVVPVFEVESYVEVPRNKAALLSLLKTEHSVYFHRYMCFHCQKFPGIERWIEADSGSQVTPFMTTRREIPYQRWEPIYIGSHFEPLYSEALSWEGLQDKMLQMLEMCLLDYKLVILDGAFLVHWPGIKKVKTYYETWRSKFEAENKRQYNKTLNTFLLKYKNKPRCQLQ